MDNKPWYKSLTIWGTAIIALCTLMLPLIGQQEAAEALTEQQASILDVLAKIGEVIGIILAVVGRFRAKTIITT